MVFSRVSIFRLRERSNSRGIALALLALAGSMWLAGFPGPDAPRATQWQMVTVALAGWAMVETARCLGRKWSLHHAGVLILLYAELMIVMLTLFLWLYP